MLAEERDEVGTLREKVMSMERELVMAKRALEDAQVTKP
jgi:hypothetical protein